MADPVVEQLDRRQWDDLVYRFSDLGLSQSWEYGEAVAALQGADCEHVAIRDETEVLGLASVRIKRLPVVGGGIAYISAGPLVRRGPSPDLDRFGAVVAALKSDYCDGRALILRILAPVSTPDVNRALAAKMFSAGFSPSGRGRSYDTILLDLTPEPDDLRASFGRMWRRCLRQSERAELGLEVGEGEDLYREFVSIYGEMRERKTFGIDLDPDFYARLRTRLPEQERLRSYVARAGGKPAGALVISMLGDTAFYLLGATNELGRKTRASYLLHWKVICEARERGLRWYDLGGIDADENPGGYRFKSAMGGIEASAAGPLQALPPGLRAQATLAAEKLYQRLRSR